MAAERMKLLDPHRAALRGRADLGNIWGGFRVIFLVKGFTDRHIEKAERGEGSGFSSSALWQVCTRQGGSRTTVGEGERESFVAVCTKWLGGQQGSFWGRKRSLVKKYILRDWRLKRMQMK
ncbi:hypothetical protein KP509_05G093100 [Ceratopteris richardii]|uniref:Uncharacterized protein n=1 Tax=Ceratopteris richardii TaxID=49495 RepID=A0A8T2UWN0_CERRI|nr:hypothetical protein KP509_05G093100 [Ceratopteris richardii]